MRRIGVLAGAVVALAGPSLATAATVVVPQRDYPTPEAAIRQVAKGLATDDADASIQAFAIDRAAAGFDFDRYVNRLQAIDPLALSPSSSPLYRELNRMTLLGRAASQLKITAYSLLTRQAVDSSPIIVRSPGEAAAFRASVDPRKLAGLRVVRIAPVPSRLAGDARYRRTLRESAAVYGAAEATERAVLYGVNGKTYFGGATLLRYGRGWHVQTLSSAIYGTPSSGRVEPMTPAEFRAKVSGTG